MPNEYKSSRWLGPVALGLYFCLLHGQVMVLLLVLHSRWQLYVQWATLGAGVAAGSWLALGDGRWYCRMAQACTVMVWVAIVWRGSVAMYATPEQLDMNYQVKDRTAMELLCAAIVVFTPVRWVFGLSLARPKERPSIADLGTRFSLRQSFYFITAIAVTLAVVRIVLPLNVDELWDAFQFTMMYWPYMLVDAAADCLMVVSTAAIVVFYPRWVVLAAIALVILSIAPRLVEAWLDGAVVANVLGSEGLSLLVESSSKLWHVIVLFVVLRLLGYRLQWTGPRRVWRNDLPATSAA